MAELVTEMSNKTEGGELVQPVSVIVPARNASSCISGCLSALKNQTYALERYEIIVIDDGSSDKTAEIARSAGAEVITSEPSGPAAARNLGAKHARGEILLFTDADCKPASDWIEKMLKPFEDKTVMGVKGAYVSVQKELISRFVQVEYEGKYEFMSRFREIDFIDTYSAGFRRGIFLSLDGFDASFPGASVEDQEFSFRMSKHGHKMVFAPEAVVGHLHVNTFRGYFKKKFKIGFWKVKLLKKHPDKMVRDTHTPQTLKLQIPVSFLLPASLLVAPFTNGIVFFLLLILFIGLGSRESMKSFRKDSVLLAVISPYILLLRSWGLGLGLIWGAIKFR